MQQEVKLNELPLEHDGKEINIYNKDGYNEDGYNEDG